MAAEINIGTFDEVVELLRCETTKDERGAKVESYTFAAHRMANVELSAGETDADYNVCSERSISVTMYRVRGISTRWRLRWRGRQYGIKSLQSVGRMSPFVIVTAEEVQ